MKFNHTVSRKVLKRNSMSVLQKFFEQSITEHFTDLVQEKVLSLEKCVL